MRIRLLPSAGDSLPGRQYLTTFLVNDTIAIDAGSLGFSATLVEQRLIRHVFLSHSHMDHIASLPAFLENVYTVDDECATVYGSDAVLRALQGHVFNDQVWPDFIRLSEGRWPFLRLQEIRDGEAVEADGVRMTPVAVDHPVPTFGFVLEEAGKAIVIVTDTGPTRELWRKARDIPGLKAVFLDASFPNSMAELARVSQHLTPALFEAETSKVERDVRFLAVHIKAPFRERVIEELESLELDRLEIAIAGKDYEF